MVSMAFIYVQSLFFLFCSYVLLLWLFPNIVYHFFFSQPVEYSKLTALSTFILHTIHLLNFQNYMVRMTWLGRFSFFSLWNISTTCFHRALHSVNQWQMWGFWSANCKSKLKNSAENRMPNFILSQVPCINILFIWCFLLTFCRQFAKMKVFLMYRV